MIGNEQLMRSVSPSEEDRLALIKKLFSDIDANSDKQISFEEIHSFLTKKSSQNFDEDLLREIFNKLDKDENSTLTLDEFTRGYYEAETVIKSRMDLLKQQISDYEKSLENSKRQYIEAKSLKKPKNILTVRVNSAEGLRAGSISGNKAPMTRITYENQSIETSPVPNPTNPTWDQAFSFNVSEGKGDILVEVFDSERGNPSAFLGQVAVPMEMLSDQQVHEEVLQLVGQTPDQKLSGSISLDLHWVHDQLGYLETIMSDMKEAIQDDKTELSNVEYYFKQLQKPLTQGVREGTKFKQAEAKFSERFDEITTRTFGRKVKWGFATQFSVYLLCFFSILSMFARPDFVNLTVGTVTLYFFYTNPAFSYNYRISAVGVFLCLVYDFVWFFEYIWKWVAGEGTYEDGIRRFSLFISFINFLGKFFFGAVFWKNSIDLA